MFIQVIFQPNQTLGLNTFKSKEILYKKLRHFFCRYFIWIHFFIIFVQINFNKNIIRINIIKRDLLALNIIYQPTNLKLQQLKKYFFLKVNSGTILNE